jgi:hypothetical protein
LKKWVLISRSRIRQVLEIITAGIAKITMKLTTSMAHTNRGMRFSDMPGVRSLRIVQIRQVATTSADTSVNVISCAQTSARLP